MNGYEDGSADPITDLSGVNLYFVHVDGNAAAGGDGTYESPLTSLTQAEAASGEDNYVFMHSGSVFNAQSITLKNGQSLLGEGATGGHVINALRFGQFAQVALPDTGGAVPVIQNAPGAAVQLADDNVVSGLTIDGAADGIASSAGTTAAVIDRVAVQNLTGYGLDFQNTGGTVTIDQYTYTGGATGAGGIRFTNFDGTATVSDATIGGGAGTGVDLQNCGGAFTFTDTTITDTGGIAFNVAGSTATVDFTGRIAQSNNAAAVSVSGGHTGTLTFAPATAGDDVVAATGGTGLQFDAAHGAYTFGQVTLNGGDAGIDVTGDSDGTFTFSNATITDPSGTALNVVGGSAAVAFTGRIAQSNNAAAVSVSGGHTGTMTFTPATAGDDVVAATGGTGLQFVAAHGTYNFGQVTLNGGDAGIDVTGDSTGTFTFSDTAITNPTGVALNVVGGTPTVSLTLSETLQNNANRSVVVQDMTGGAVTVNGDITDTGAGVLVQNNADAAVTFNGLLSLNTGANNAVNLANNTDSTITFNGVTIETTSGNGFAATGGGTIVFATGATNTISTTTGTGLRLDGVTVGDDGMSFESISVDGAANGILLADVTGGTIGVGASGTAAGDGGTLANTTGHAVSAANVADLWLNYMTISGAGGDAVHVVHNDDNASWVTVNETNLSGFAGQGVELAATGAGQMTLDLTTNTFSGGAGEESILLGIDDSAETVLMTITGNSVNNGSGHSALALNVAGIGMTSAKTVTTLIDGNTLTNTSAASATVDVANTAWGTLNATVTGNTLNNGNASGTECQIVSNAATATVFLDLRNNVAGSGGGTYDLTNTAGTFKVYDLADVDSNNSGTVNQTGSLTDSTTQPPMP